jgi:hypothetical protein
MSKKIFSGAVVCVFLISCSPVLLEKEWVRGPLPSEESIMNTTMQLAEQTVTFDGLTYDRVYEACEQALIRLGYSFYIADKEAGRIRVQGIAKREFGSSQFAEATEFRHLLVTVKKTDDGIVVQSSLLIPTMIVPSPLFENKAKNEVDRFFRGLNKELK